MANFEVVSKYADKDIPLPSRGTAAAAGYDFIVAEDTIVPSYSTNILAFESLSDTKSLTTWDLNKLAAFTKGNKIKPTLVSTGIKCNLEKDKYLELSVRSSTPLKYWLILANGVGIIDAKLKKYYVS